MANTVGIRTISFVSSAAGVRGNQAFTSNVTLATVGLIAAIAANQTIKIRAWIPFTVGATGGFKCQLVVPAGSTAYNVTAELSNTVAPSTTLTALVATAAIGAAVANAGTHWILVEGTIVNGATAGNIDLQCAQNSSDVLTMTVLRGGVMECVTY